MFDDRRGGVRHRLAEAILLGVLVPGLDVVVRHAAGVDQRLALGRRAADGQLLERAAVAAHGVALEVRQHQHGIVVEDVLAQQVLLEHLAVGDVPHDVGTLGVHQVDGEVFAPAVVLDQLPVGLGMVAHAAIGVAIGGVALHDRAVDRLDHRLPELGAQEILVSLFAGVQLDRDLAGELQPQQAVQLHHLFRADFAGKVYFRSHLKNSFFASLE